MRDNSIRKMKNSPKKIHRKRSRRQLSWRLRGATMRKLREKMKKKSRGGLRKKYRRGLRVDVRHLILR